MSVAQGDGDILTLGEMEKRHIFATLEAFDQNRTKTAKHLGISIRICETNSMSIKLVLILKRRLPKIIHERAVHDFRSTL